MFTLLQAHFFLIELQDLKKCILGTLQACFQLPINFFEVSKRSI